MASLYSMLSTELVLDLEYRVPLFLLYIWPYEDVAQPRSQLFEGHG